MALSKCCRQFLLITFIETTYSVKQQKFFPYLLWSPPPSPKNPNQTKKQNKTSQASLLSSGNFLKPHPCLQGPTNVIGWIQRVSSAEDSYSMSSIRKASQHWAIIILWHFLWQCGTAVNRWVGEREVQACQDEKRARQSVMTAGYNLWTPLLLGNIFVNLEIIDDAE